MARRLSKSAPLKQYNDLMIKTKELEKEVEYLQKKIEDRERPAVPPKRGARAPPPPPQDDGGKEAKLEVRLNSTNCVLFCDAGRHAVSITLLNFTLCLLSYNSYRSFCS